MSSGIDGFELRDSLIALPQRLLLLIACIPIAVGAFGFYLNFTSEAESVRTAGILLITLSTPTVTIVLGLAAAARVRTDDIDRLVAKWLCSTVRDKLSGYLVGIDGSKPSRLCPPLFRTVRALPDAATSSYCLFELVDFDQRQFFLFVKSNIFNVEICAYVTLACTDCEVLSHPILISDLEALAKCRTDARVRAVADTLHGAISEGYGVYISNGRNSEGDYVCYRIRQKLASQFITSPFTRRYFAEDIAIWAYWLYLEMRSADAVEISGSRGPLTALS